MRFGDDADVVVVVDDFGAGDLYEDENVLDDLRDDDDDDHWVKLLKVLLH